MKKSSCAQLRIGARTGNPRGVDWGVGLSVSFWDLGVVYRLGQVEIGFGPSGIIQSSS